jgi:hypothetical protein
LVTVRGASAGSWSGCRDTRLRVQSMPVGQPELVSGSNCFRCQLTKILLYEALYRRGQCIRVYCHTMSKQPG